MVLKRAFILSILTLCAVTARSQAASGNTTTADTILFDDGSLYIGQVADSLFNGYGRMVYADSTIYEGEWKNGFWEGDGELFYPDGDRYKGHFSTHEFNGYGEYYYTDGAHYEGNWKDGLYNGAGTMNYADGSIYAGEWKDDMMNGYGVLYSARDKAVYKGYFENDEFMFYVFPDNTTTVSNESNDRIVNNAMNDILFGGPQSNKLIDDDGRFQYKHHTTVSITYGMEEMLSLHIDIHPSNKFFAGFQLGFNTVIHGVGKISYTTNDETGEKVTLVGWDWYKDEILTENTYTMVKFGLETGISLQRFSIGTSLGIGLDNTVRNCRSKEGNNSYFEPGTLYYRNKITGTKFAYDVFAEYLPKPWIRRIGIALRAGYSNVEHLYMGLGVVF